MAATLQWEISTAATTPSWSSFAKLRFKTANDNTDDLNNPLVKPSSGTNYSFEKWTRINVTVAPSSQVSNLRLLLSANPDLGITWKYGFTATYATPIGTVSTVATSTLTTAEVTWQNAGTKTTTGQWGDLAVHQLHLGTTVAGGEMTAINMIARYDEI